MSSLRVNLGNFTVIEGEATGADTLARETAKLLDLPFEPYPAQWEKYGRAAGPIRNSQMLLEGKPNAVVAFHTNLAQSKGTANMVNQARKAGLPVWTCEDGHESLVKFIQELKS